MAYEKTLKLVTNLDRGAVEAKIAEIRDSARSSQLAELASLLTGVEGLPRAPMETRVKSALKRLADKDREIERLNGVYERALTGAGVEIIRGRAVLKGANEVEVSGRTCTARHILVATGAWPRLPQIPGAELAITSNEAFHLQKLPSRALVVGGGYIAVEFASIFNGVGVPTTLAYRGSRLLRGFDAEIGERLGEEMARKGVDVRLTMDLVRLVKLGAQIEVLFRDDSVQNYGLVMFATGRRPVTRDLGLEAAGVKLSADGAVVVDKYSRSTVDSIYAIGDVTNRINLTPVATAEAMWLARTLFRNQPTPVDHANVPTAVFANPNLASVGLSEEAARKAHGAIDVYKTSFRALKLTLTETGERTFMKLIVERASQRVVGAHMIGPDAGEVIQGVAIAVKLGATKADFDATLGIHPKIGRAHV